MQPVAAVVAMVFAALTGLLLRRWCVGKRHSYALDPPDPSERAPMDAWQGHVAVMVVALFFDSNLLVYGLSTAGLALMIALHLLWVPLVKEE